MKGYEPRVIPVSAMYFVAMGNPRQGPSNTGAAKFSVSFPVDELPADIAELMPRRIASIRSGDWGLMTAQDTRKPMIFGADPKGADMAEVWSFCDAIRCSIDEMLRGTPARLTVNVFESATLPDGVGLGLTSIQINPDDLFWPTPEMPRNNRLAPKGFNP